MNYLGRYKSDTYTFSVNKYCDILGVHIIVDDVNIEMWITEKKFLHFLTDGQIKKLDNIEPSLKLPKFSFNHTS